MEKKLAKITICKGKDIRELDVGAYILIAKIADSSILGEMCFIDVDDIQKIGLYIMMKDLVQRMEENEVMMDVYEKAKEEGILNGAVEEVQKGDWK